MRSQAVIASTAMAIRVCCCHNQCRNDENDWRREVADLKDDDLDAPVHLTIPDGTKDEQLAWLRAEIQKGIDSGPGVVADQAFFERIKRRGRDRLRASRRAA